MSASKIVVERGGVATRRVETNDGDIYRYAGTAVYWKNLKESEWSQDGNDSFSYSDGPNLLGQYCVKCTITRKYTKTKEGNYTVISWWVKNLVEGGRVPQIPKRDPDPRNKAKGGPPGGIKLPVMYHRLEAEGWAKVRFTRTITFSHEVCSWCFTDAGQTEVWNEAKKKAKENRDNGVTSSDEITTEVVEWGKKK